MSIKDSKTGRHYYYNANHGIQRDPLRDAIRGEFPTSGDGWNVNDVDLRVCLFGAALNRPKNAEGWIIEFEAKKNGADLKWSQACVMELLDSLASKSDVTGKHWGGCWLLQLPDDLISGGFRIFRPLGKEEATCVGVVGLREWIKQRSPKD